MEQAIDFTKKVSKWGEMYELRFPLKKKYYSDLKVITNKFKTQTLIIDTESISQIIETCKDLAKQLDLDL